MSVTTGCPLDRSTSLMAQMTRPGGTHIRYGLVWIIKISISPIFTPKSKKCVTPYGKLKSYNSDIVQDRSTLFASNWGFSRGRPIKWWLVPFKLRHTPDPDKLKKWQRYL